MTPAKGFYHCFGCQAGGDVIDFVMKTDMVTFAGRLGEAGCPSGHAALRRRWSQPYRPAGSAHPPDQANTAAAKFFRDAVLTTGATGQGVPRATSPGFRAADVFAVGFALPGWDNLVKRLRAAGFTDDEMVTSGLALRGDRGPYDRFRGRIVWPIRDLSGESSASAPAGSCPTTTDRST